MELLKVVFGNNVVFFRTEEEFEEFEALNPQLGGAEYSAEWVFI